LGHYHYDYFQALDSKYFEGEKFSFQSNLKGDIDKVSVKLEPAVDDIIFVRKADVMPLTADIIKKFTGNYDFGGALAKVYSKTDKDLFLFIPGQPEYELIPVKENEFSIKSLSGFTIRFTPDDEGYMKELVSIQPNGTFRAERKK
jgi:hypothetical protein